MFKRSFFIFLLFFFVCPNYTYSASISPQQTQAIRSIEPIKKSDRIFILAPHPDDEAIGCAGIIQQALTTGAQVYVVYLTNGDHNQFAFIVYEKRLIFRKGEFIHMGELRRKEAIKAMKLLGLNEENLIFLGYPDFGTFTIFSRYWVSKKPFRSLLTRISSVPYKENLSFGAPYVGESILNDLKNLLLKYKPNKIFVSHPADVNVDHKTFYLFLQIALADLKKEIPKPKVYPYLVHCIRWPLPRHYHPELPLAPPQQFLNSQINWLRFELTPAQLNKKYQAILTYRSQTRSSAFYLLSFTRRNELFGDYPDIELNLPTPFTSIDKIISFLSSKPSVDILPGAEDKENAVIYNSIDEVVLEAQPWSMATAFTNSEAGMLEDLDNIAEGKGEVCYSVVDESLLVRVDKTKELNHRFSVVFYLFGYNRKTPFAAMPKIRIITKYKSLKVFDGKKIIKAQGINLELAHNELILKIPLKILNNPDFVLASVKSYTGILPMDAISFRKIKIR